MKRPLQKWRSGFRQKAAFFNFQGYAALCRDAAAFDGWFCRGPMKLDRSSRGNEVLIIRRIEQACSRWLLQSIGSLLK
jgi:hypothetical protein